MSLPSPNNVKKTKMPIWILNTEEGTETQDNLMTKGLNALAGKQQKGRKEEKAGKEGEGRKGESEATSVLISFCFSDGCISLLSL